jgi:two-component system NtrC family response regulator
VLQKALARSGGTLATAARLLGVSRPTLYSLLEAHGMTAEAGRGGELPDEAAGGG